MLPEKTSRSPGTVAAAEAVGAEIRVRSQAGPVVRVMGSLQAERCSRGSKDYPPPPPLPPAWAKATGTATSNGRVRILAMIVRTALLCFMLLPLQAPSHLDVY